MKKKLIKVPLYQQDWFYSEYGFLKDHDPSECPFWEMLLSNIIGNDDRYIADNHEYCFLTVLQLALTIGGDQQKKAEYIMECCLLALIDARELEFYEIAANISNILQVADIMQNCIEESEITSQY